MQKGIHLLHTGINCKKKKTFGSWTFEATLVVKEAQDVEGKHSGV